MNLEPVVPVDVGALSLTGRGGVVWGTEGEQLNVNVVKMNAGDQIATHVGESVDVLLIVHSGSGVVVVDGTEHALRTDHVLIVPSGAARSIRATTQFVYYSIHQPHEGLVIRR